MAADIFRLIVGGFYPSEQCSFGAAFLQQLWGETSVELGRNSHRFGKGAEALAFNYSVFVVQSTTMSRSQSSLESSKM